MRALVVFTYHDQRVTLQCRGDMAIHQGQRSRQMQRSNPFSDQLDKLGLMDINGAMTECLLSADDPEGSFVPPEFDNTGSTFEVSQILSSLLPSKCPVILFHIIEPLVVTCVAQPAEDLDVVL